MQLLWLSVVKRTFLPLPPPFAQALMIGKVQRVAGILQPHVL